MGISAFCFPIVGVLGLVAITTTMQPSAGGGGVDGLARDYVCTVYHHVHECGMAWQRGHVQRISIT